TYNNSNPFMT
nr:Chain B, COPII-binding peptide of the integral membrane protein SED5 [synthetic construct]